MPLIAGQVLRRWVGPFLARHRKLTQIADRGTILMLVYTSFCDSFARHIWGGTDPATLALVIAATVILFFLVLLLLWALCDRFGIAAPFRAAVVFCGTKKSLAQGVPMAHLMFPGTAGLGLILLPIMIYHPLQLLICTPLASRWAKEHDKALED